MPALATLVRTEGATGDLGQRMVRAGLAALHASPLQLQLRCSLEATQPGASPPPPNMAHLSFLLSFFGCHVPKALCAQPKLDLFPPAGGPLILRDYVTGSAQVVGIVSHGPPCDRIAYGEATSWGSPPAWP